MKRYVEGCNQCQRIKNRAEMLAGKLRPNQVPERPWQHILDREPQFVVGLMRELNKMLGIETKLSMAYHLKTDRQMERTNQELE